MKIPLQYLNDENGKVMAVQMPLADWEKVLSKLNKYEQALQLKSELKEALDQVAKLKKAKGHKQNLAEFLNEV